MREKGLGLEVNLAELQEWYDYLTAVTVKNVESEGHFQKRLKSN